jgi:hypothetical protein
MWYRKVAEKVASKVRLTGMGSIQRVRIPEEIVAINILIFYISDVNVHILRRAHLLLERYSTAMSFPIINTWQKPEIYKRPLDSPNYI